MESMASCQVYEGWEVFAWKQRFGGSSKCIWVTSFKDEGCRKAEDRFTKILTRTQKCQGSRKVADMTPSGVI